MSNVAVIDPRPSLQAGGKPMAIVPKTMEETYRLATAVCKSGLAPYGLDTPEKCMIAMLHGLEIGLTPMMALQRIAVINGRPTIFGDAAIGLVRASGLAEWIKETITGESDARTATCATKRKGDPVEIVRTFSVADAKVAKLWGKTGPKGPTPWVTHPDRMLAMRARGFCLRDGYSDVLGGLYLREEIEDDVVPATPSPPVPPTPPEPPSLAHQQLKASVEALTAQDGFDFDALRAALDDCPDEAALNAVFDREVTNRQPPLPDEDAEEADAIMREVAAKFWTEDAAP